MEAATLSRECSDEELVEATRAGDDRAFEQLYARYQRRIAAYVLGMVKDHQRAEDVTQEVFLSALRRMRQTERPIAFKAWIYEIARNACIDQFRRTRRSRHDVSCDAEDGVGATLVAHGPTPDMALQAKQQLADLQGAFGGLSEAHHRILVMRELEGLSYVEIGERLGMSKSSVESTLFRARKRLSEEYDEVVSGERCLRVQGVIARAETGRIGAREQRRMARHLSYCQPCRRAAAAAGLSDLVPARTGLRAKIAGFLPLPVAVRERWLGTGGEAHADGAGGGLASWAHALMPAADAGGAGWAKLAATAATVAIAGFGAQQAVTGGGAEPSEAEAEAAAAPVRSADRGVRMTVARQPGGATAGRRAGGTPAGRRAASGIAAGRRTGAAGAAAAGGRRDATGRGGDARGGIPGTAGERPASGSGGGADGGAGGDRAGGSGAGSSGGSGSAATQNLPSAGAVGDTAAKVPTTTDVTQGVGEAARQTTQTAGAAVQDTTQAVGGAVSGTTGAVGDTVRQTGDALGDTVDQVGQAAPPVAPVTQAAGETVRGATGAAGGLVERTGEAVDRTTTSAGAAVNQLTQRVGASATHAVEDTTKGLTATLGGD